MTVKALKQLIRHLPNDMEVLMDFDGESLVTVCKLKSGVVNLEAMDDDGKVAVIDLLLLLPCDCEVEQNVVIDEAQLN